VGIKLLTLETVLAPLYWRRGPESEKLLLSDTILNERAETTDYPGLLADVGGFKVFGVMC
jgi:hypothetical protein